MTSIYAQLQSRMYIVHGDKS